MTSSPLTTDHAQRLTDAAAAHLAELMMMRTQLERGGILPTDAVMVSLTAAIDRLHDLRVKTHYVACGPGTVGT